LSLVSEDLFGYIPGIGNHSHAAKELSISQMYKIKETTNFTKNAVYMAF